MLKWRKSTEQTIKPKQKATLKHSQKTSLSVAKEHNNEGHSAQQRKVKGLLNRLSDLNFSPIVSSLVDLYYEYPRNELTILISEQILSSLINTPNVLERFILQFSSLVVVLSSTVIIGNNFGIYFIIDLMNRLKHLCDEKSTTVTLMTILAQFYSLRFINEKLISEFCDSLFLSNFFINDHEIRVEMLLRFIRIAGPTMRQESPETLWSLIKLIESNSLPGSRFKFMLEALDDLKNNKKRLIKGDSEILLSWRKLISEVIKQRSDTRESHPLTISLQEALIDPITFEHPLEEYESVDHTIPNDNLDESTSLTLSSKKYKSVESVLRINTSVRRKILTAISDSFNVLDATKRLNDCIEFQKERKEIPPIILLCVRKEPKYNPFYALLASTIIEKVDGMNGSVAFMYSLWDFAKSLSHGVSIGKKSHSNQVPIKEISNMAFFYADLISKGGLSLSSLKGISWHETLSSERLSLFLAIFIVHIFKGKDQIGIKEIFIAQTPNKQKNKKNLTRKAFPNSVIEGLELFFIQMKDSLLEQMGESDEIIAHILPLLTFCTDEFFPLLHNQTENNGTTV